VGADNVKAATSPESLKSVAEDPAAFAAVLQRLSERGSSTSTTEADVVEAWAAVMHQGQALLGQPGSQQRRTVLGALEELTRRHLVALAPDQLGFVFKWVLADGLSMEGESRGRFWEVWTYGR
jgi:hypothetical protein